MNKSNSERKIAIATGTRADWGLLMPLASELRRRGVEPLVIASHAHFFEELGMTVEEIRLDGFEPAFRVPTSRCPADATADAIRGFSKALKSLSPDILVILGDRFEMLGAASAALLEGVPVAHIAGGNISLGAFDNAIRNAISQMATIHLPETDDCARRLVGMGIPSENILAAGSPGVFNALNISHLSLPRLEESLAFPLGEDFLLATLHAATLDNESPLRRMEDFLNALKSHLLENPGRKVILTYPNSDSDPAPLISLMEKFRESFADRVLTIPSLGRVRYLSAAALARAVVGNSSSGIEETPSLGVPTLDIGNRQKGRERGPGVFHCEGDTDSIIEGLKLVTSPRAREIAADAVNPYFRENTPALQADFLLKFR